MAYQRTKSYDALSFLYLSTGDDNSLRQMLKIAELRGDFSSRFQNTLYLGDAEERIRVLKDVDQRKLFIDVFLKASTKFGLLCIVPLAYMTAKAHGLTEEAEAILAAAGKTEEEIQAPSVPENPLAPPKPAVKLEEPNWPQVAVSKSFFEGAFANERSGGISSAPDFSYDDQFDVDANEGDWGADDDELPGIGTKRGTNVDENLVDVNGFEGEEEEEGGGWDDDDDFKANLDATISHVAAEETAEFVAPTAGTNETAVWSQNSPLAADHIAAGAFESAMQALNRQVGIVNFEPLKPHFLSIYQASRITMSPMASNPALTFYLRRNPEESNTRASLPVVVHNFQNIIDTTLQAGYKSFTSGRLAVAATEFKSTLQSLLFTVVNSQEEVEQVAELVGICREYIIGLALEQKRRAVVNEDPKLALELAAYFTHCELISKHRVFPLRQAAKQAFKLKNFITASQFTQRLLELPPPRQVADEARQIQSVCERTMRDEIDLAYDQYNPFVVCNITFEPIYKGSPKSDCPFCHASYKPEFQGKLCTVCEVAQIGANATGLRVTI